MLVFAIIFGVSEYESKHFHSLPAAKSDAISLAHALVHWGIPESHITLFCRDFEKRETLEQILKEFSKKKEPFQLIFYYCGHGIRTTGSDPKSYLLFSDSEWKENSCKNALEMEAFLPQLHCLNATKIYLFIDACHIRLNSIVNPKLTEEIQGKKLSEKSFFCIASSGIHKSYESTENHYGYFTDALLKAFTEIRQSTPSPSSFFQLIQKELQKNDLPDPEMYNIETHAIDFFPPLSSFMNKGELIRMPLIGKLEDAVIRNRGKAICLSGPRGCGKTTLACQFASAFSHYPAGSVFIFEDLKKIGEDVVKFKIPPLTKEETRLLQQELSPIDTPHEIYYLASRGNPQKLKKVLHNINKISLDFEEGGGVKKAIAAVYSCGVFINEELFRKTFSISHKELDCLEKLGLIFQKEGVWYSHDFLIEIVESEQLDLDRVKTLSYWSEQCNELPGHFLSASNFAITMKCFGYEPTLDAHLKEAFQVLYNQGEKGLEGLKNGASIFLSFDETPLSALFLAEVLLEWGEFDLVKRLLQTKKQTLEARVSHSHFLWRTGLFSSCIQETSALINKFPPSLEIMKCYLYRGASHFFLGNWNLATEDFLHVHTRGKHPFFVGRARCLLGTISGIRGLDIKRSKELIESGIQTLSKHNDRTGAWIGWNNLGEILWKEGNLRSSVYHLERALEIAEETNHPNLLLETLRNLLQWEYRLSSPNESKILEKLEKIELLLEKANELVENMQLYNTLCTIYLYLDEPKRAQFYLQKAIPLTIASNEYYIYSLSNLALLSKANGNKKKTDFYFRHACNLAQVGNNLFALQQIESDFQKIKAKSPSRKESINNF